MNITCESIAHTLYGLKFMDTLTSHINVVLSQTVSMELEAHNSVEISKKSLKNVNFGKSVKLFFFKSLNLKTKTLNWQH